MRGKFGRSLLAVVSAVVGFGVSGAQATGLDEVRVGAHIHGEGPLGSRKVDGAQINAELLFDSPSFLAVVGSPRPHIGGSYALEDNGVSQGYIGLTWHQDFAKRLFIEGSLGGAIHDGEVIAEEDAPPGLQGPFLGCRALFRIGASAGVRLTDRINASLHWDHISNANLCDSNEGLDNLGARIGWQF